MEYTVDLDGTKYSARPQTRFPSTNIATAPSRYGEPTNPRVSGSMPAYLPNYRGYPSFKAPTPLQNNASEHGGDTPMSNAYDADDDATPRPRPVVSLFARQYPRLHVSGKEGDYADVHAVFVNLRQIHILEGLKDDILPLDDNTNMSWNTHQSGMLGVSELVSLAMKNDVCTDQGYKPDKMLRLFHRTTNTPQTHEFVNAATDALMNYLRPYNGPHGARCGWAADELYEIMGILNRMITQEDAIIEQHKPVQVAEYEHQLILREPIERAFELLQEQVLAGNHTVGASEIRRIVVELDFASMLDNTTLPLHLSKTFDEEMSQHPVTKWTYSKHVSMLCAALLTSRHATNAMLSIALGILQPLTRSLDATSRKHKPGYAKFKDYPAIASPMGTDRGMTPRPSVFSTPTPSCFNTPAHVPNQSTPGYQHLSSSRGQASGQKYSFDHPSLPPVEEEDEHSEKHDPSNHPNPTPSHR